jgi:hypothetical protein
MSKDCFACLCGCIEDNVGECEFKSDNFLHDLRQGRVKDDMKKKMLRAHDKSTGGFLSGEVKVALTLRLLAGGSYLDLSLLYELGLTYAYTVFHDVLENWICDDGLVKINGDDYLNDIERMKDVACDFAGGSTIGIIGGCIGALDGWLVKIKKPSKTRDGVQNVGGYWSRKGYFAINCQVIVDKKKRVLYRSILCRGAEHDSSAFKASSIYKTLLDKTQWLYDKGLYFIGDSAYSIRSFLLTPYDNAPHASTEDNFNFHHSSSRISVECAFGEVDMRWGIFWKPLKFSLKHSATVIDAALRLHNFIVDYREAQIVDHTWDVVWEREVFMDDNIRFIAVNPDVADGIFGGEEEQPNNRGRPRIVETTSKRLGVSYRNKIRDEIARVGLVRPTVNWYKDNNRMFSV